MRRFSLLTLPVLAILFASSPAFAFGTGGGACGGDCRSCHSLNDNEAQQLVSALNPAIKVLSVEKSAIGGLWEIKCEFRGQKGLLYVDYEKKHIVQGSIIDIATKRNITSDEDEKLNTVYTNPSKIPLQDALVLGNPKARLKVIVFDDPV
ncbi:MAG: hypothetical protein M0018_02335 [Nitrospiraceae bacterium]|nr:hypothetical protein [Nitrospiraceae bacterium]